MLQSITLNNLFLSVTVNYGVETFKYPPSHQVSDTFFLDPESLYLIVDVEKQGVITRGIVTGSYQKASRTRYKSFNPQNILLLRKHCRYQPLTSKSTASFLVQLG